MFYTNTCSPVKVPTLPWAAAARCQMSQLLTRWCLLRSGAMRARGCSWLRAATFCTGFAVITVVAFADGGYFRVTWGWTTLALVSLVWIVLLLRDKIVLGRYDLTGLALLASFVGWVGLSAS